MVTLAGIFKSDPEEAKDSDKLLDLYWNRAELKKEFYEELLKLEEEL